MSNLDLTRILPPLTRHLSGARLQQGRSLLDADFNEAAEARALLTREAVLSIVGPVASPDDGFLPDLAPGQVLTAKTVTLGSFFKVFVTDWRLKPGTLYAGGVRFTQDDLEPATFQRGYLQMGPGTAPRAALGRYRQLAVLRGWEQPVTAVEDGELMEPAMGGADTTTRVHRRSRVEVYLVNGETCADAFDEVLDELTADGGASYDPATASLLSNARLQIGFLTDAADDCAACRPRLAGRYLGGEAHAIRIMLATPTTYVWALDTLPLYRVKLTMEGSGVARIDLLTPPKDKLLEPRHGAVVEFLPWASLLRNGVPPSGKAPGQTVVNEKVSTPVGFFAEAIAPYDAATRSLRVRLSNETLVKIGITQTKGQPDADTAAQQALKSGEPPAEDIIALQWDPQHPRAAELAQPGGSGGFTATLYMRAWHAKGDDAALAIPTAAPKPLGRTGLVPHFFGAGIAGDSWTVAVSPLRSDVVLPLELLEPGGVPPHGPHRVLAPLALVDWDAPFGLTHIVVSVADCRPALPSVADRGCCTVWVGPGDHGDTDSIQQAVHRLPARGGRICILPGTYREEFRVFGRRNVIIEGCGARTEIVSPEEPLLPGLVTVDPVEGITAVTVRRLSLMPSGQAGLHASGHGIAVHEVAVRSAQGGRDGLARSAIEIREGGDVRITGCEVAIAGPGPHAAIALDCPGGETLVEGNTVEAVAGEGAPAAWGGIHVEGGSHGVEIRGNRIRGGYGHGITLGSVSFRARNGAVRLHEGAGTGQTEGDPPAVTGRLSPVAFDANEPDPVARLFYPEPDAEIADVLIAGNRIEETGGSGIGSLAIRVDHAEEAVGPPLCMREPAFRLRNLTIRDNVVRRCAARPPRDPALPWVAGGIALSAVADLSVCGNTVEDCGAGSEAASCGIHVAEGVRLAIRSNRLRGNGPRRLPAEAATLGGGIVLAASRPVDLAAVTRNEPRIDTVQIAGNTVEQPDGAALVVVGTGPVVVSGNHLETVGSSGSLPLPGVTTALVVLLGPPAEAVDIPPNEPDPQRWLQPAGSQQYLTARAQILFGNRGGGILLSGNTVVSHGAEAGSGDRTGDRVALAALTTDAVTAVANTVSLRAARRGFFADALVVGATAAASANSFSETLDATPVSLAVAAPMLTCGAENTATHCVVVHGGPNDGNPDYEEDRDNLVLLRPREGGCDVVARELAGPLGGLVARLFDLGTPPVFDGRDFIAVNATVPRGGGR